MSIKKNRYSVALVRNSKGRIVGYLSERDIENGLDGQLDIEGFTIEAID